MRQNINGNWGDNISNVVHWSFKSLMRLRYGRVSRYFMLFVSLWFAVLPTAQVLAAAGGTPVSVLVTRIAPGETTSVIDGPNGFQIVLFLLGGVEVSRVESGTPNTGGGGGGANNVNANYAADAVDANIDKSIPGAIDGNVAKDLGIPPANFVAPTVIGGNAPPRGPFAPEKNPNPEPNPPIPPVPPIPPGGDVKPPVIDDDCDDCLRRLRVLLNEVSNLDTLNTQAFGNVHGLQALFAAARDGDGGNSIAEDATRSGEISDELQAAIDKAAAFEDKFLAPLDQDIQQIESAIQQLEAPPKPPKTPEGQAAANQVNEPSDKEFVKTVGIIAGTVSTAAGGVTGIALVSGGASSVAAIIVASAGAAVAVAVVGLVVAAILIPLFFSSSSPTPVRGLSASQRRGAIARLRAQSQALTAKRNQKEIGARTIRAEIRAIITKDLIAAKQKFAETSANLAAKERELNRQRALCRRICPPGTKISSRSNSQPNQQRVVAVAAKPATTARTNFNAKSNATPYQPISVKGNKLTGKFDLRAYRNSLVAAGQRNDGGPLVDLPSIFGDQRFNIWVTPSVSFNENTNSGPSQNGTSVSINGGVSWLLTPTVNVGLVARYANTRLKGLGSKTNSDTWSTGGFVQALVAGKINLNVTGVYSHSSVNDTTNAGGAITTSKANADAFSGQASLSRSFKLGEFTVTPALNASYVHINRKAFFLSDGTLIGRQKSNQLTFSGGPTISRTFEMGDSGVKVTPSLGVNMFVNASRAKSFLDVNGIRRKAGNYGVLISTGVGFKAPNGMSWALNGGFSGSQGGQRSFTLGGNLNVPLN